jgi:hypothetical protein
VGLEFKPKIIADLPDLETEAEYASPEVYRSVWFDVSTVLYTA